MRLLLDMNLSPHWVEVLSSHDHQCQHWSQIGHGDDPDDTLLECARTHNAVLFTADEETPPGVQDSGGLIFSRQAVMNSILKKLPHPEKPIGVPIESLEKRLFLLQK